MNGGDFRGQVRSVSVTFGSENRGRSESELHEARVKPAAQTTKPRIEFRVIFTTNLLQFESGQLSRVAVLVHHTSRAWIKSSNVHLVLVKLPIKY
jgi:hypothetical protein